MAEEEVEFDEGEEEEEGEGGGAEEPEEEVEDRPLTKEEAGENLSLLCKTGNGLAHAYVRMDLRDKELTDISILNCFVHIRYLDISGNSLQDIGALNGLPQLLTIKADHNRLTSAKLEELQYLQIANFANNKLTSTEGITHPMLETLNLSGNHITELEGLTPQNLPSLRTLDLHSNALTSTVGIQLPGLQKLYLASNRLAKLEGLEGLRQLTTLHLRGNRISSCDGFAPSMEALQYLNFRSNQIEELAEIKKLQCLPFLRALVLAECPVIDLDDYRLEVLVSLRRLERLDKDPFTGDERADAEEVFEQRKEEEEAAAAAAQERGGDPGEEEAEGN